MVNCLKRKSGVPNRLYTLKVEVVLRVVIGDVLNHLVHTLSLITSVGHFAVLDVGGNEVAENATEVLVTRVGEEGT